MSKLVTVGDTVRLKVSGDLYAVEEKRVIESEEFLVLSRYGHLSGTVATAPTILRRRDEVVLLRLECEFVDGD
jgi:hypothetical protein